MMNGSLVNARHGTALHPTSPSMAGGMTYRGGTEAGSQPQGSTSLSPGTCPMPTKLGLDCGAQPTGTGLCVGHSRSVAKVIGGLFGAV